MKEIKEINDDAVIRLSIAVFEYAIRDYKNAHRILKKMQRPDWMVALKKMHRKYLAKLEPEQRQEWLDLERDRQLIAAERTISEVENLFHSSIYCEITGIDGDAALEHLKKKI